MSFSLFLLSSLFFSYLTYLSLFILPVFSFLLSFLSLFSPPYFLFLSPYLPIISLIYNFSFSFSMFISHLVAFLLLFFYISLSLPLPLTRRGTSTTPTIVGVSSPVLHTYKYIHKNSPTITSRTITTTKKSTTLIYLKNTLTKTTN